MTVVRGIGWVVFIAAGILDLWLMVASSLVVAAEHGLVWTVLGWIVFPVGVLALPIAAGYLVPMIGVYVFTFVGAAMAGVGRD